MEAIPKRGGTRSWSSASKELIRPPHQGCVLFRSKSAKYGGVEVQYTGMNRGGNKRTARRLTEARCSLGVTQRGTDKRKVCADCFGSRWELSVKL